MLYPFTSHLPHMLMRNWSNSYCFWTGWFFFCFVLFCIFLQSTRKLRCFRIAHIIPWNTVGFWHGFAFSHLSFYTLCKWLTRFVPSGMYKFTHTFKYSYNIKQKRERREKNTQSQLRLSWKSIHAIRNEISQITENSTLIYQLRSIYPESDKILYKNSQKAFKGYYT